MLYCKSLSVQIKPAYLKQSHLVSFQSPVAVWQRSCARCLLGDLLLMDSSVKFNLSFTVPGFILTLTKPSFTTIFFTLASVVSNVWSNWGHYQHMFFFFKFTSVVYIVQCLPNLHLMQELLFIYLFFVNFFQNSRASFQCNVFVDGSPSYHAYLNHKWRVKIRIRLHHNRNSHSGNTLYVCTRWCSVWKWACWVRRQQQQQQGWTSSPSALTLLPDSTAQLSAMAHSI